MIRAKGREGENEGGEAGRKERSSEALRKGGMEMSEDGMEMRADREMR